MQQSLLQLFIQFGLAGLIGFVVGLERSMAGSENPHAGTRDFIMFSLIGAVSAYAASLFDNSWLIIAGFLGALALLISGYWIDRNQDSGVTTEISALFTFFLGVLIASGATELAIALAIVTLAILSQKKAIHSLSASIHAFELQAALKFLIITFIILPVLPNHPLSDYLSIPIGTVSSFDAEQAQLTIKAKQDTKLSSGDTQLLYDENGSQTGQFKVENVDGSLIHGVLQEIEEDGPLPGTIVHYTLNIPWLAAMLSALNPYKIWLIVVLVSMISLVGYVLVKILGPGAGTGLTGLIGGLASSTVTTVSFARRSVEAPGLSRNFAVAVLLASSIMFPRLLLEIAIVNQQLMKNSAVPLLAMGATGILLALYFYMRSRSKDTDSTAMQLDNPFCLKSAITFALVFSMILILTRMATVYLGERWLPLVAVISGFVDADAIAFSLSDAHKEGIISLDWASFNLVLGALSNTCIKLFLVFFMGHKKLFGQLLVSFLIVGLVGIATTLFYYNVLW